MNNNWNSNNPNLSLVIVTTIPATIYYLLSNQIPFLLSQGIEVSLISSNGEWITSEDLGKRYGIKVYTVPFTREYSLLKDVAAFLCLFILFMKIRPDIVHYSTPKASLLSAPAAFFARIRMRIYTIRGTVYYAKKGLVRMVLECAEWITCLFSTRVLAVSNSNKEIIIQRKLCPAGKIEVLAKGSSQGVDAQKRFNLLNLNKEKVDSLRKELAISPDTVLIGYVGRLAKDKGIEELLAAWLQIKDRIPHGRLMLIGPSIEKRNKISNKLLSVLTCDPTVLMIPPVQNIEYYYALIDILILPSYREGFPNVVLEAGAMEVPSITFDTPGCIDSVVDNVTGFIVHNKDVVGLAERMLRLLENPELRKIFGNIARDRTLYDFNPERINSALLDIYRGIR